MAIHYRIYKKTGKFINLTVNDVLKIKAIDDENWIDFHTILIGSDPIFHIDQGVMGKKDIFCLGFLGSESPTILSFGSSGYTNCVRSDIGKPVKKNGVELPLTVLADYDNDPENRRWWLSRPHSIPSGSAMTIDDGAGAGTTNDDSEATRGGALQLGQGFEREDDPPRINLTDSGNHVLYITAGSSKPNGADAVLADMKLRNLHVKGDLTVDGDYPSAPWGGGIIYNDITIFKESPRIFLQESGAGTPKITFHDIDLYRQADPAALRLDDNLVVDGWLKTGSTISVTGNVVQVVRRAKQAVLCTRARNRLLRQELR